QREDMVVTVSHAGYVKRVPLSAYRAQRRGGKGRAGMQTREEDFVTKLFVASTHTPILFFSSTGMAYRMKVWRLPVGNPQARGKALINLLPLKADERITTLLPMPEDEASWANLQIMFATRLGNVRRNQLSDFESINRNGKIAMKLDEGDQIAGVDICTEAHDVLLTTAEELILTVSANGYGKRTSSYEYRITGRGGKGIVAMTVNSRNGPLVASFPVDDEDQIMLVTDGGQLIRCPVHDIRKAGRSTQGV